MTTIKYLSIFELEASTLRHNQKNEIISKFSPKNIKPIVHIFQRPGKDRDSKHKHRHVPVHEEPFSHVCMLEGVEGKEGMMN